MNRWVGVSVVVAMVIVGIAAWENPQWFPGDVDVPGIVYLLMALLLVSGAGYGFHRFRYDGGKVLLSIVIWGGLILAITLAYPFFN
jgi:hypothetical protein